jgi:hypothetical protein
MVVLGCRPMFPATRWTVLAISQSFLEFFDDEYTDDISLFDYTTG